MNFENNSTWTEEEYTSHLNMERNLYSWCLENYGNYTKEDAKEEALIFYVYESKDESYRGIVFHDEAWHWAMLKIFGEGYWITRPEINSPCKGYEKESEKYL